MRMKINLVIFAAAVLLTAFSAVMLLSGIPEKSSPAYIVRTVFLAAGLIPGLIALFFVLIRMLPREPSAPEGVSAEVDLEDLTVDDPGLEAFYELFLSLKNDLRKINDNREGLFRALEQHFSENRLEQKNAPTDDSGAANNSSDAADSRFGLMEQMVNSLIHCRGKDAVLEGVLGMSSALTRSRRASVMLLDETGTGLRLFETAGWEPDPALAGSIIPLDAGLAGKVVAEGKRMLVTDVAADLGSSSREGYESRSFIILPIRDGERVIGVLNLTEKENRDIYTLDELELLNFLLNLTSLALGHKK